MKDRTMCVHGEGGKRLRRLLEAGRQLAGLLKKSNPSIRICGSGLRRRRSRRLTIVEAQSRGEWIYLKRIQADLSRETLAQKLCVGDRTVQSWEHNETLPTAAQWLQLKEVLN